jgi:Calx-beta domain-containing protein
VREGDAGTAACAFVVSLSGPLPDPATVDYATADGTATAGTDYVATSGTVTFAPGTTTQTVAVAIVGDATAEAEETFSLALSAAAGAVLVDASATGTITNDDPTRFYSLTPCRLVDTRGPAGTFGGPPLQANSTRTFPVAGGCAVPASARAVAVNLTVVNPNDLGDLRAYPAGGPAPLASVINFVAGRTRANNAVLALGEAGATTIQCDMPPSSSATTHFLIDVYGYFQ